MTEEKSKSKEVSSIEMDGVLYNQIYNPDKNLCVFLALDNETQETIIKHYLVKDNIRYIPIYDQLLEKGAVILPSGITDYGCVETLQNDIDMYIQKWLDISDEHRQKAVWYVLLTWMIDKLNTIPYLRALGDYGTGKTRYEDVIGGICYIPMFVGGAVRSAPIYRTIDLWHGTVIFDEFNLQNSSESEYIIQVLNQGYQRGKVVLRCEQNNITRTEAFDPFGAKIISTRRTFKDRALESRCITEVMTETNRNIPPQLTKTFYKERNELQNKLLKYRLDNINEIEPDNIDMDFGNIMPRIKQSFYPFAVLFSETDKETFEGFKQYVINYNRSIVEDNSMTLDGQIINIYYTITKQDDFLQDTSVITTTGILKRLQEDGWGDKINVVTVGRRLKALGFVNKPKTIRGKTQRMVSINDDRFEMLKRRYISVIDEEIAN